MESVVSKLQETGQQAAKKSEAILARTRDAGEAFLDEVRDAGRDLVLFAKSESKGWKRFFTSQKTQIEHEAKSMFTLPAIEKRILATVGDTLQSIDAKLRDRIALLEKKSAPKRKTTKAKKTAKSKPAVTNGAAVRH